MEKLNVYPLFTGITRPAMFVGVTLQFFVVALFPCLAFYIATTQFLMTLLFFAVLYVIGFLATLHDERFLEIAIGLLSIRCPNKTYWNCLSYDVR